LLNRFSLVTHSVFYHNDYFPVKSLENKVTLVDYSRCGNDSRGGSQIGNVFTYCILDWGYLARNRKQWMQTHGAKHGIDQNARVTKSIVSGLSEYGRSTLHSFETNK
jgi:hypothetical protein